MTQWILRQSFVHPISMVNIEGSIQIKEVVQREARLDNCQSETMTSALHPLQLLSGDCFLHEK